MKQKQVRLVFSQKPGVLLPERICLSSGTTLAARGCPWQAPFQDNAYVPRLPWRSPSADELSDLLWGDPMTCASVVGIVDLGAAVLEPFRELGLSRVWTIEEAYRLLEQPKAKAHWKNLRTQLLGLRHPVHLAAQSGELEAILPRLPGLASTTLDYRRDAHFTGLHLDNWERSPLQAREDATGRLSLNLGSEDRFFLFIPLTVVRMAELLGAPEDAEPKSIASAFMEAFPEQPVVRVRVRPGEAYVAPTENIVHDGSTQMQSRVDLTVNWRGRWMLYSHEAKEEQTYDVETVV